MAAKKKAFPLRIPEEIYRALEVWARDDLRSVNAQIELLLRRALEAAGRHAPSAESTPGSNRSEDEDGTDTPGSDRER